MKKVKFEVSVKNGLREAGVLDGETYPIKDIPTIMEKINLRSSDRKHYFKARDLFVRWRNNFTERNGHTFESDDAFELAVTQALDEREPLIIYDKRTNLTYINPPLNIWKTWVEDNVLIHIKKTKTTLNRADNFGLLTEKTQQLLLAERSSICYR